MYDFIVWEFLQPFPLLILVMAVGLAWLWRKHRDLRRRLLWVLVPFLLLLLLSLPAVAYFLQGSLEWRFPPLERRPADREAIVVLGSAVRRPEGSRLRPELDEGSLNRCLKAAELYHQDKPCLVVVSGGMAESEPVRPTVAEAMREFLISLGVAPADIILEEQSRSTYENAVESSRLLDKRGLTKVILVTDAYHMARSMACFRKQGLEPLPCCCYYRAPVFSWELANFWPNPKALAGSQRAGHEWLGMAWYWWRGKI